MARTAIKKSSVKTRRKPRKKKKPLTIRDWINIRKIVYLVLLLSLLVFSVGMVGYVIFFRTVVAGELPFEEHDIIFEEPNPPRHKTPDTDVSIESEQQTPRVAIIIDDMGYHQEEGRMLLSLDLNLSFSFLPYAPFTPVLEEVAYQNGKTILLHLPLEPRSPEWDPGPGALYLKDDQQTRRKLVVDALNLVPHATGVNNHMGSLFTEDEKSMTELMDVVKDEQLFFVDSYTTSESKGLFLAQRKKVPATRRHIFLDNVQETQAICKQINKLVNFADQRGSAVGIGHPYPETVAALETCGKDILKGTLLVGVEDLLQ